MPLEGCFGSGRPIDRKHRARVTGTLAATAKHRLRTFASAEGLPRSRPKKTGK